MDPLVDLTLQHSNPINIAYSIEALQDLIEEEKQEALTDLGDHYRSQLQALQEHITALQQKLVEAERKVSLPHPPPPRKNALRLDELEVDLLRIW